MLEYWFQKNNMAPASTFWFRKWKSEGVNIGNKTVIARRYIPLQFPGVSIGNAYEEILTTYMTFMLANSLLSEFDYLSSYLIILL